MISHLYFLLLPFKANYINRKEFSFYAINSWPLIQVNLIAETQRVYHFKIHREYRVAIDNKDNKVITLLFNSK